MNQTSAREVLLLQAFESVTPASASWTDEDRGWATRLAFEGEGGEAFIARRAHHAMQRLLPREPALAKALARPHWRAAWVLWAVLLGFGTGLVADSIGSSQRINLLAPPVWAVIAWNLAVYALLAVSAITALARRTPGRPGLFARAVQRLTGLTQRLPAGGASAAALSSFAVRWTAFTAPISAARAATLLHAAAAALGLGLMAGLYARGLVLDYRAMWQSTFLSADTVHALLRTLLAPAALLSGITLPDAAGIAALQTHPGASNPGAPAAPWIHLYAWTLLLAVVLPRAALALASAGQARWRANHLELPLAETYFRRLLQQQRGDVAEVQVLPYAQTPGAQTALGLRALLTGALGDSLKLQIAPTVPFGAEDESLPALPASTNLVLVLFDLAATPEAESHGRFAQRVAAHAPVGAATVVLVDEAAFKRRFGGDSTRVAQRRDSWQGFVDGLGSVAVFADLDAQQSAANPCALLAAIAAPVRGAV